jgi:hypothetical protein
MTPLLERIKGVIVNPDAEWAKVEAEDKSVLALYRDYVILLAAIPPLAGFLAAYFFGFSHGHSGVMHETFMGGLARAALQYLLSLPILYLVAFVISNVADFFEGKADDRKALTLAAYSYTPAWLASAFALVPGFRWLDVLGFYGIYVFYHGLTRMLKLPKDNADVFTLAVLFLCVAAWSLHAWIVYKIIPWQAVSV